MVSHIFPPRARTIALALVALMVAVAPHAEAFCGFYVSGSGTQLYNKATRVSLMRDGTRTVLAMSNDYQGPPQDFAMVVPVPVVLHQENVRTLPMDVFDHLESLTAPRLVEYWEQDPCYNPPPPPPMAPMSMAAGAGMADRAERGRDLGVRVEARFVVGEYQVVVLSATESSGLETWLHQNHYNIPAGAAAYLAPYVRDQFKFFVARVDISRVAHRPDGTARLSPLRFAYDSPDFRLPVRLGLLNASDAQDLIVYVLHPTSRFEVANYPNAFIPTNLDVADSARGNFGELYARLFDYTMEQSGGRAVVTEYAWGTNSCDPCPTPPLAQADLVTLGADALAENRPGFDRSYHVYNMTVTRLHTRYNRATLTEDLIFREAGPIVGGREFVTGANGQLEQGVQAAPGSNNFQARYAIRHPWTGRIACAHPRRGVWGGPPNGGGTPEPVAARDLASVPRGRVNLAREVRSPIPAIAMAPASGGAPTTHQPSLPAPPPAVVPTAPQGPLPPGFQPHQISGRRNVSTRNATALVLLGGLAIASALRLRRKL